jgi:hypothetical protein
MSGLSWWGQSTGQGWTQLGELGLASVLSAAIGLEREVRQKSAGLRTHTLVGFAAALFMLVSKYRANDRWPTWRPPCRRSAGSAASVPPRTSMNKGAEAGYLK